MELLDGVQNALALKHVPDVAPRQDWFAGPEGRRADKVRRRVLYSLLVCFIVCVACIVSWHAQTILHCPVCAQEPCMSSF
jgi:hypothetical protein